MPNRDVLINKARAVKARHEQRLLALPGVVGVGVGLRQRGGKLTDEVCIVVMVRSKRARGGLASGEALPARIEGIPVDVQETGDINAGG